MGGQRMNRILRSNGASHLTTSIANRSAEEQKSKE
ncbi:Uncharacterized protein BM_BM1043 [Brugia malayi]|uniref:Uncharacterized protein n=1 Tax=Brugia malayi TaxID=6279 RepID=A0A4E9FUY8_BRUMA|nr:Uncharacterized protein BM_BM1043 [Brugia malayi]VIO96573.1 Uncharacterized protein BM_BM1043 [Brugia malayi]